MSGEPRVEVAGRAVGAGAPVLIVAEAGVNHDGELDTALALVDAAADAGADAVKFQTFDPDALVTVDSELASYQRRGENASGQHEMLVRLRLDEDAHAAVLARCRERGILFLSTPFDAGSAALLARLGVPAFKVGSGELTNLPFLEQLGAYGLPIMLSTGMSDLEEVGAAVEVLARADVPVVLLHCVSSYPAPEAEANLRAMDAMRAAFGVPVGYSDHCLGLEVSLAAVARDACLLERHFTLDRTRPGPDHSMSLEPDELAELVRRVRALESWLGDGEKRPQPSEHELRTVARRSVVAARALAAGDVLTLDSLAVKRPAGGLPPSSLGSLAGRRLTRALRADEQVTEAHLEPRP
jgi:N-acetylneuraminate synthase